MKQHITSKQVDELNMNQSNKLDIWWNKLSDESKKGTVYATFLGISIPLLSIGQMIEFLDDNNYFIASYNGELFFDKVGGVGVDFELAWTGDLCDNIWEAVKLCLKPGDSDE